MNRESGQNCAVNRELASPANTRLFCDKILGLAIEMLLSLGLAFKISKFSVSLV